MSGRKHIVVATELSWPLNRHYDLLSGIQEYADMHTDWIVDVSRYPEVHMARGQRYDAVLGRISKNTYTAAVKAGIPMVNSWINSPVADRIPCVHIDPVAAGRMAAQHLIARGFRRLVCYAPSRRLASDMFCDGMTVEAQAQGISCAKHLTSPNFESSTENWARTFAELERHAGRWQAPIGIGVFGDELARGLTCMLQELSWMVPEQVAMVSTGNSETICTAVVPTLSSIDLGYQLAGFEAAKMAHQLLEGGDLAVTRLSVPPKSLIVRRSSDVYAVRDPQVALALRYMAEHSHRSIGVPDIVKATGIGRQGLERRFRNEIGETINNELIRLRIERLKRLLVETEKPVKELGPEAGFGTAVNMHNTFKRLTGLTPVAYREAHTVQRRW